MSSYFSRLIQQTNITLGTGEGRKAEGRGQKAEGIEPNNESTSFLATEREQGLESPTEKSSVARLQEKSQSPSEGNIISTSTEFSSSTASSPLPFQSMERQEDKETRKVENKDVSISPAFFSQDAAKRKDYPSPKSASTASSSSEHSPQSKQLKNRVEFSSANISSSHDVGTRLNFANKHPELKSEKILESRTNIVQKTGASQSYQNIGSGSILLPTITASGQNARTTNLQKLDAPQKTPQSPETLLPRQSVGSQEQNTLGESLSTNPKVRESQRQPTAISKEYNPLPTRQVNLQTVREWVAGAENSKLNTQPFQFPNPKPQEKQNFRLSIGTISLTVEAPPPEVQQPPLPPSKPQQKGKTVSPTSRINRHYLRL